MRPHLPLSAHRYFQVVHDCIYRLSCFFNGALQENFEILHPFNWLLFLKDIQQLGDAFLGDLLSPTHLDKVILIGHIQFLYDFFLEIPNLPLHSLLKGLEQPLYNIPSLLDPSRGVGVTRYQDSLHVRGEKTAQVLPAMLLVLGEALHAEQRFLPAWGLPADELDGIVMELARREAIEVEVCACGLVGLPACEHRLIIILK